MNKIQRYKVTIAYDGTEFSGFQSQPNQRTVQGVLEKALKVMTKGLDVSVFGAGRTDAGVHALGQVVHFDYPLAKVEILPENMLRALNSLMPYDLIVKKAEYVDDNFHARFSPKGKRYRYRVQLGKYVDPFRRNYTGHYAYNLKVEPIKTALKDLAGTHDFTSFCATGSSVEDKVRTIYEATVEEDLKNNELIFEFYGDGFLYNMVRILVGTLLEIGNGRRDAHDMLRLFEVKDRKQARVTAPASGLYMKEIYYDED